MSKSTEANAVEVISDESTPWEGATQPLNEVTRAGTAPSFAVVKAVTRPVLTFGAQPEYIRIESPMYLGEKVENAKYKDLPMLLEIINLKTGEAMIMVCAAVFKQELLKSYPKDGYVGKDFQVRKIRSETKKYALWAIAEIEVK